MLKIFLDNSQFYVFCARCSLFIKYTQRLLVWHRWKYRIDLFWRTSSMQIEAFQATCQRSRNSIFSSRLISLSWSDIRALCLRVSIVYVVDWIYFHLSIKFVKRMQNVREFLKKKTVLMLGLSTLSVFASFRLLSIRLYCTSVTRLLIKSCVLPG